MKVEPVNLTLEANGKVSQLNDLSRSAKHGTQPTDANRPALRRAPPTPALSLPDNLSHVHIAAHAALRPDAGSFAIAVWYRPSPTSLSEAATTHSVVSAETTDYTTGYLINQNGVDLAVYVDSGGPVVTVSNFFVNASAYDANQWYFITVVGNAGTGLVTVYRNGVLVGTSGVTPWSVTENVTTRIGRPVFASLLGPNVAHVAEFTFCKGTPPTATEILRAYLHRDVLPNRTAYYPLHGGLSSEVAGPPAGTLGGNATWGNFDNRPNALLTVNPTSLTHTLDVAPPATFAFVARRLADGGFYQGVATYGGGSPGLWLIAKATGIDQWGMYTGANSLSGQSLTIFKSCLGRVRAFNDMDLRTNGASATVAGGAGATGGRFIGSDANGGNQALFGELLELAVWNRVLSVQECRRVERYLRWRHGTG